MKLCQILSFAQQLINCSQLFNKSPIDHIYSSNSLTTMDTIIFRIYRSSHIDRRYSLRENLRNRDVNTIPPGIGTIIAKQIIHTSFRRFDPLSNFHFAKARKILDESKNRNRKGEGKERAGL